MAEEKAKELVSTGAARYPMSLFDIDKWFEQSLLRPFAPFAFGQLRAAATEELVPAVDLFEEGDELILKAELPGIKKEDIDITLNDGSITLSGEKKNENEVKKKDYYKWESTYGSFCRMFTLPTEVQADKVKSTFKDGILEVRMPKSEQAKSKEVKVKIQ